MKPPETAYSKDKLPMAGDLMQILASFVPPLVTRRIASGRSPSSPMAERSSAAVLFADITDFTAISDKIAASDPNGSELIAQLLNDCFGHLIDVIHAHGGEVAKFAGDALIAIWPVSEDTGRMGNIANLALAEEVQRAAQCGLALQEALFEFEAPENNRISIQVGIGAGNVYSVYLGGVFNRWEFLLSGSPLVQMIRAKELAQPGQVLLSSESWELAKDRLYGRELTDKFVELIRVPDRLPLKSSLPSLVPPESKQVLQSYIPAAILARLEAGQLDWLSELRQVTVLFVKLPGYGTSIKHPYRETVPLAQSVMLAMQGSLYRYAGSINKFNVDDKGITLVAAMGLPPLSHEDDPARAVHAALEMQAELRDLGRESAIGITTGWVFCGPIGNKQRREYTLVGNAVNMAARLMQAASSETLPGKDSSDIYCDQATYEEVQEQANRGQALANNIAFTALPPIGVKGKVELVAAFRPNIKRQLRPAPQSRRLKSSRIIGFRQERDLVSDLLQEQSHLKTKKGNIVLVIDGEAGMGKSLLISEALSKAKSLKFTVLFGAADELDRISPFLAWQSIFSSIYDVNLHSNDTQSLRSRVLRQLPPIRGEKGFPAYAISLSPLLNSVLPLGFPETRTTLKMSDATRIKTTHSFLLRLLQRQVNISVSRRNRPLMIVIENGQWLDPESFELLIACVRLVKPILVVIATRPITEPIAGIEPDSIWDQVRELQGAVHLSMPLLTNGQAEALVCQKMGVKEIAQEAASILIEKTGGHPAHSQELVRSWLNAGFIEVNGEACTMAGDVDTLQRAPIPPSIQKSIAARIERLAPQDQLVLKIAACIGPEFTSTQLIELYPLSQSPEQLNNSIERLVQVDLIRRRWQETNSLYRFCSTLVQEVASSLLPSKQRQMLC